MHKVCPLAESSDASSCLLISTNTDSLAVLSLLREEPFCRYQDIISLTGYLLPIINTYKHKVYPLGGSTDASSCREARPVPRAGGPWCPWPSRSASCRAGEGGSSRGPALPRGDRTTGHCNTMVYYKAWKTKHCKPWFVEAWKTDHCKSLLEGLCMGRYLYPLFCKIKLQCFQLNLA